MNNSDLIQIMLDLTKDKYGKPSLKEIRPIDRILSNSYPHRNPIHFHHPITNDPYTFSIDLDDDDSRLNAIRKANEVFNKIRVDLGKQGKYSEFRMDFPEWGFEVYLYYDEIEIDIDIARRIKIIDNEELNKQLQIWGQLKFKYEFNKSLIKSIQEKQTEYNDNKNNDLTKPHDLCVSWLQNNSIKPIKINISDALWSVADDLRDRVPEEFPTYRDAYRWWCKHHTHKGKDVTWKSLENEYKKAKGTKV